MFQLNNLNPLVKKRKRIGRGGSRGGTCGKGHKGQRARTSGNARPGFEGGQMPLSRRMPKRGFNNAKFRKSYSVISLSNLEKNFKDGDIITKDVLFEKGIIKSKNSLIKILGGFELSKKFDVTADAFSESAKKAIGSVGGKVQLSIES